MKHSALLITASILGFSFPSLAETVEPLDLDYLLEARTFCVEKDAVRGVGPGDSKNRLLDSIFSIPHCITFVNGKALFQPKNEYFASATLAALDYKMLEDAEGKISAEVSIRNSIKLTYQVPEDGGLLLKNTQYKERFETPNPGYYVSANITHYVLIDARSLEEEIEIELFAGPIDERNECSTASLKIKVEPGVARTYSGITNCGKSYGTFLEDGNILMQGEVQSIPVTFNSMQSKVLQCATYNEGSEVGVLCGAEASE